jgi:CheY-like chemotaxis protein
MMLQALLVSKDDQTAETLTHVLAQLGVAVVRSSTADVAVTRLREERFDQLVVDFEDPETASLMLESCRRLAGPDRDAPVMVALLADTRQIRAILGNGAHFVLPKPVSPEQALTTLRAAMAILKRERRQALRVAVQAPVSLRLDTENTVEGIMLDLSTGGMDVLAAKPVASSALVRASFALPDGDAQIDAEAEVAWSAPTGQLGLRFLDMDAKIREQLGEWLKARSSDGQPEDSGSVGQCKLTDLSLGGCYVETESPFPQSSAVDLCLRAADMEVHAEGVVRVMHPSHGMGIEFPASTEEQRQGVGNFIECLTRHPGAQPQLEVSPRALVASAVDLGQGGTADGEAVDPLLELLRSGSGMEEGEFLAELTRQRTPADVSQ